MKKLNLDTLKRLQAIQVEGEPSIVAELIDLYLKSARSKLEQLTLHIANQNLKAAQAMAHSLKSSSLILGGEEFGDLCQQVELLKGPSSLENATSMVSGMNRSFDDFENELFNYQKTN